MSVAISLRDILDNFRGLLVASQPFLVRAGVEPGDDEWDEFQEAAFELVVGTPIEEAWRERLEWRYATWDGTGRIVATATGSLLVGKARGSSGGSMEVAYEERTLSRPIRYAFREFRHPLMEDAVAAMGFVLGEVVDDALELPRGAHVCAPLSTCVFELGSMCSPSPWPSGAKPNCEGA